MFAGLGADIFDFRSFSSPSSWPGADCSKHAWSAIRLYRCYITLVSGNQSSRNSSQIIIRVIFQGFKSHKLHEVLVDPGTADVTANVDFRISVTPLAAKVSEIYKEFNQGDNMAD